MKPAYAVIGNFCFGFKQKFGMGVESLLYVLHALPSYISCSNLSHVYCMLHPSHAPSSYLFHVCCLYHPSHTP